MSPKLCMVTDGANNTLSIRQALPFPATPILDWFHISMKIRHMEQIARGLRPRTETERSTKNLLAVDLGRLRWCLWHNNASKLDKTLRQILLMCRIVVPETPGFEEGLVRIDYRIRDVLSYVLRNSAKPVAYGRRHRKGQAISSAMAESAVKSCPNVQAAANALDATWRSPSCAGAMCCAERRCRREAKSLRGGKRVPRGPRG
jgi:hypothetical protein